MDIAGVDGAINHPPGWDADSNRYTIESAWRYPDRFAGLCHRRIPVQKHARYDPSPLRRIRSPAVVLGNRYHPPEVYLAPGHHDVHRGASVAPGERQGPDHGRGLLSLVRLGADPC